MEKLFWRTFKNKLLVGRTMPKMRKRNQKIQICRDALGMVGLEGFNVLNYNCEHFTNECRYGEAESEQITNVKEVVNEASTHIGGVAGLVIGVGSEFLTKPENRLPSSILFSDIVEKTDGEAFDDSDFKELMAAMKSLGKKLDNRVDLRSLKFKEEINVRILMIMRYRAILMSDPSQYMLSKKSRSLFYTEDLDLTTTKALMVMIKAISEVDDAKKMSTDRKSSLVHLFNMMMLPCEASKNSQARKLLRK